MTARKTPKTPQDYFCPQHEVCQLEIETNAKNISDFGKRIEKLESLVTENQHSIELFRQAVEMDKANRNTWEAFMIERDEKLIQKLIEIQADNTRDTILDTAKAVKEIVSEKWYIKLFTNVASTISTGAVIWLIYVLIEHAQLMPH